MLQDGRMTGACSFVLSHLILDLIGKCLAWALLFSTVELIVLLMPAGMSAAG